MLIKNDAAKFIKNNDADLISTKLKFKGMEKGTAFFHGSYGNQKINCNISEIEITGYYFQPEETIANLICCDYVTLIIDGEVAYIED